MLHHALDATRVAILDLLIYAEAQARLPPPLFPYTTLFRSTASKLVMFWTAPSSTTRKSSLVSPVIGLPFLSVTTTSTDRKSTRLNSSPLVISYAAFCLKKKKALETSEHPQAVEADGQVRAA